MSLFVARVSNESSLLPPTCVFVGVGLLFLPIIIVPLVRYKLRLLQLLAHAETDAQREHIRELQWDECVERVTAGVSTVLAFVYEILLVQGLSAVYCVPMQGYRSVEIVMQMDQTQVLRWSLSLFVCLSARCVFLRFGFGLCLFSSFT